MGPSLSPILEALLSIIGGGLAGTAIALWFERRQRRREAAVEIAQAYMEREKEIIHAEGLYNKYRQRPDEWSHDDTNALTSIGDWYEIISVLILENMVDERLIKRIGIDRAMYVFHKNTERLSPLDPDRPQWKNLEMYMNRVSKYISSEMNDGSI